MHFENLCDTLGSGMAQGDLYRLNDRGLAYGACFKDCLRFSDLALL